MNCSACGHANPDRTKFCTECGAPTKLRCGSCGGELVSGAKFCGECGSPAQQTTPAQSEAVPPERSPGSYTPKHLADKILQSKSALEGERKQVTVLFADVKGSMELAEQAGAEGWHAILDRFFGILADGVHRFEGTVNQYTGDGIMALFGAPIAHEDHAQRACYAALHLRDALRVFADELRRTQGVSLSTRIGINSGEVVVGRIGDDLRMDYTAKGHSVGLAQRMEQLAAADSIYLTANTAHLVEGYFQLRDLGEFDLKGTTGPLSVYELQSVGALRTRLDSSRARGFSKFVGRNREMASLESALESAIAGSGQVVGVVADAGTGKSRLCLEFVERCRARGVRVNEAHCPAHGRNIPYLPLLEMLRDVFGIEPRDSDHEARRKIAGELMLLDESFQELLPILFEFMGVGDPAKPAPTMSPEGRQQRLYAFVRHLLHARSQQEPGVLFLDDLHWIDPGSDAFLAHSIEAAEQTRTLWLVNFRPEYQAGWMGKSYYQQLPLRPLGPEAIAALLKGLLGSDPSVAALPARIHERTGGNPFFTEEIVQSLVENGSLVGTKGDYRLETSIESLEIPSTVHSVLAARLDRLGEREKRLLQTASVIGKEFTDRLLRAVVAAAGRDGVSETELGDALVALARAEFIFEQSLYPEVEYAFKHPLTQEVAYNSLLTARRAELHGATASAIEAVEADKLDERAALLAYHWEHAGEPLKAAHWYGRAAEAAGLDSPSEALRHWERVWELSGAAPRSAAADALRVRAGADLLILGFRQGLPPERVSEIFEEAKALAIARDDVRQQVRLLYAVSVNIILGDRPRSAIPYLEEALALSDRAGVTELRWAAREPFEWALVQLGELADALRMNDEQVAFSDEDPSIGTAMIGFTTSNTFMHRGAILMDLGRFEEAIAAQQRAEELSRRFEDGEVAAWNDTWRSRVYERTGDAGPALASARRAVEAAEKIGSVFARAMAHGAYGTALGMSGDWSGARKSLDFALEIARTNGVGRFMEAYQLAALAAAHLGLGDGERAREAVEEAIQGALRMEMPVAEILAQLSRVRVLLALDGAAAREEVENSLSRADELVTATGAASCEPQIHLERARLAEVLGDDTARTQLLRDANRRFRELGAAGYTEQTAALLAEASR